ncbi:partner of SLD five, PSF2 [Dictyocaulus viviparus]|uniref:GINS complex subunit 2 n=1 Tax=Dictyocaulus viviparus TaxID=29172 RepID=A0A0D8Y1J0_DICVI|nr:partner of SLD five, PSF2 [Dictyocaulus viviparus]
MDPEHCEFLAEDELIRIIPRRNEPTIHLVCGDVGPLEAGVPVEVPLWLAVDLRKKQYCEIVASSILFLKTAIYSVTLPADGIFSVRSRPPHWFCLEELKRIIAVEGETAGLSRLPPYIFEISSILVRAAKEDITNGDQIKVLMQDLWDKREAKLRTSSFKLLSQHAHAHVRLDSVQPLEVASIRPNLSACREIARLVRNAHSVQPD